MNSTKTGLVLLVVTFISAALWARVTQVQGLPDKNFRGRVYDLDYLGNQGWTQVEAWSAKDQLELVAVTRSESVQQILQVALLTSTDVNITYRDGKKPSDPEELVTVDLVPISGCSEKGCVEEMRCSAMEAMCTAKIKDRFDAKTDNPRALGILLTAISKKKAIEGESQVDDKGNILRVRINVPSTP